MNQAGKPMAIKHLVDGTKSACVSATLSEIPYGGFSQYGVKPEFSSNLRPIGTYKLLKAEPQDPVSVVMAAKVAGMDIPAAVIDRIKGIEKKKQKQEGIKIAVESIQKLKEIKGVRGIHIMAIEWEEAVPEIVQLAKLMPRAGSKS